MTPTKNPCMHEEQPENVSNQRRVQSKNHVCMTNSGVSVKTNGTLDHGTMRNSSSKWV